MALVTTAEVLGGPDLLSDRPLTELIDGTIVEMPPMGGFPVELASRICGSIDGFARPNGIGRAISEILIRIDEENSLRPDVIFVSAESWALKLRIPNKEPWAVVPELVIEVVSEYDRAWAVLAKVHRYFEIGSKQVWLVYPDQEVIHVFDSIATIRVLTRADVYEGGDLIPGFRLTLESLFEGEKPAEDLGA